LSQVIESEDKVKLSKVPGVGKKTAERLVLELKDKLPKLHLDLATTAGGAARNTGQQTERLVTALTGLGYRPAEAERASKMLMEGPDAQADLASLLRKALQILSG
jgi:Holliday junction DNA helicase RuvA